MDNYDVIVIGAGFGGVTTAALLAKEGHRVLLLDKNNEAGGKGLTIKRHGHVYEMWGGVGVPANNSRFHELVAAIGAQDKVEFLMPEGDVSELHYKDVGGIWHHSLSRSDDPPTAQVDRLRSVFGATDEDLAAVGTMFNDVMALSDEDLDGLDEVGALDWLRGFGFRESLVTQFLTGIQFMFCAPVNRIPVSETVRTLRDTYTGGAGRYHRGGYGQVAEVAAEYVASHGGKYLPGTRVERILVEDGRVAGVATKDGEFRAPVVVSNAGIQPTVLKLIGPESFPAAYVEYVRRLEPSLACVGVRYFLDEPVLRAPMSLVYSDQSWWDDERYAAAQRGEWPDVSLLFVGVPCLFDDSLTENPNEQAAIMAAFSSPDPKSPMNEIAIEKAEATMREVWPEMFDHIIRREPYHALHVSNMTRDAVVPGQGGEAIGVAQVIGQCGKSKPDVRAPLPGLYYVGCDAGGYGAGTHQAADSGFKVAAIVAGDLAGRGSSVG